MVFLQLSLYVILAHEGPFNHSKTHASHFVAWCYDMEKGKHIDFIQNVIHPELFLCLSVLLPWRLSLPQFPTSPLKAVWFCIFNLIFHRFLFFSEWCILAQFMHICCIVWRFQIFFRLSRDTWKSLGSLRGPTALLTKACLYVVCCHWFQPSICVCPQPWKVLMRGLLSLCMHVWQFTQFRIHLVMVHVIIWPLDFSITLPLFVGQPWCYR